MRCKACNKNLNDFDLHHKDENGNHLDLCTECRRSIYYEYNELQKEVDEDQEVVEKLISSLDNI